MGQVMWEASFKGRSSSGVLVAFVQAFVFRVSSLPGPQQKGLTENLTRDADGRDSPLAGVWSSGTVPRVSV